MRRARPAFRLVFMAATIMMMLWPAPAASQSLSPYDEFSEGAIDPARWLGYEHRISSTRYIARPFQNGIRDDVVEAGPAAGYLTVNEESTRQIMNGQAQITLTTLGPAQFDTDFRDGVGRSGLRMNHPALVDGDPLVTRMQATVTVAAVAVDPCAADTFLAGSVGFGAQVFGHFFNDGSSTGPGDLTGDVFAILERRGVSSGVFRASLGRCLTADCGWIETLQSIDFARASVLGVAYTLTITWQPAANVFVFAVGAGGTSESHRVTYSVADPAPPSAYAYDLRIENGPGICYGPASARHPQRVSMDVRFDHVRLDSTAAAAAR